MKKYILIATTFLLILLSSCRDVVNAVLDVLPPFNVPFTTTMTVPFASVSTTTFTRTPEIPMNLNLDEKIKENNPNYSINNLKSVKLHTLSFDYISSEYSNQLDVVRNARLYVKAPNHSEILVATVNENTNPRTLTFVVSDVELLEYFRTNQNSLILELQASKVTLDQITMKMNASFQVKVQL